jgi:transcriptional regulator of met regulon
MPFLTHSLNLPLHRHGFIDYANHGAVSQTQTSATISIGLKLQETLSKRRKGVQ